MIYSVDNFQLRLLIVRVSNSAKCLVRVGVKQHILKCRQRNSRKLTEPCTKALSTVETAIPSGAVYGVA